jgi:hypothetical protein
MARRAARQAATEPGLAEWNNTVMCARGAGRLTQIDADMTDQPKKQLSDRISVGCFFLATICASPYVVLSNLVVMAVITGKQVPSRSLVYSVFFTPLLLLAAVGGAIFIVCTWRNGRSYFRPFLVLYSVAIFVYWAVLIESGPW